MNETAAVPTADHDPDEWARIQALGRLARVDAQRAAMQRRKADGVAAAPRFRPHGSAIRLLRENNKIDAEQKRAADEIVGIYERITAALFCKTTRIGSDFRGVEPAVDWPEHLTTAYLLHYIPWCEATTMRCIGHRQSLRSLVFDVVVEDAGLNSLKARYRSGYGRLLTLLVEGLDLYVALAGWRRQRPDIRAAYADPAEIRT